MSKEMIYSRANPNRLDELPNQQVKPYNPSYPLHAGPKIYLQRLIDKVSLFHASNSISTFSYREAHEVASISILSIYDLRLSTDGHEAVSSSPSENTSIALDVSAVIKSEFVPIFRSPYRALSISRLQIWGRHPLFHVHRTVKEAHKQTDSKNRKCMHNVIHNTNFWHLKSKDSYRGVAGFVSS